MINIIRHYWEYQQQWYFRYWLLQNNTSIISACTPASFWAQFQTGSSPATAPASFDWSIVLYYSGGTYTYAQQNGLINNTNNIGCVWQPTLGALPNYSWVYDSDGNINGTVKVTVHISDGGVKSDAFAIGAKVCQIAPTNFTSSGTNYCSTTLTWSASSGATSYKVYNSTFFLTLVLSLI